MYTKQREYFKKLDSYAEDVVEVADEENEPPNPVEQKLQLVRRSIAISVDLNSHLSSTCIINTAIQTLRTGLFTFPRTAGTWNTEQCIGFLLHAYLLQMRYTRQHSVVQDAHHHAGRQLMKSTDLPDEMSEFSFFTGAAGTGKTFLLQACDVLTQTVYKHDESVVRSAPTRTAARLIGGDTCHGTWALPFGSVLGPRGRISDQALKKLRARHQHAQEAVILAAKIRMYWNTAASGYSNVSIR